MLGDPQPKPDPKPAKKAGDSDDPKARGEKAPRTKRPKDEKPEVRFG